MSPLLMFLLIAISCWQLAGMFWMLIAPPKTTNIPVVDLQLQNKASSFNADTFNIFKTEQAPVEQAPVQQVVTPQNLTLNGVMLASPEENSSAIISENGDSKRYMVSEKIGNTSYVLNEVHWKKVVLVNDAGQSFEIKLYETFDLNAAKDINTQNSNDQGTNQQAISGSEPNLPPAISQATLPKKPKSIKEQVNQMLEKASEQLKSNPAGYLNKMGVMAVGDGYLVTDQMNGQIRQNIGLQQGDKVISVNGQTLGQPQSDSVLLEEIVRTGSAEIQVQRGSQVITIRQQF